MQVDKEQIDYLVSEYNLIQLKESKLSRRKRDKIEDTVRYLVKEGVITIKTKENENKNQD